MKNIIGAKSATAAHEPRETLETVKFMTVDDESAGQRLDNFLFRHLKGVPKTHVYRIIRSGEVRVNKGRAQADTKLQGGDLLRLPPVRTSASARAGTPPPPAPAPELALLHEAVALLAWRCMAAAA